MMYCHKKNHQNFAGYSNGTNFLIVCLALSTLTGCFFSPKPFQLEDAKAVYQIKEFSRAVQIENDQLKLFMRNGQKISLSDKNNVILYADKWSAGDDLSADAWLLYGRKNLYFAALVKDDDIGFAGGAGEWGGDAVNLFLKTQTEEGPREFIFKFSVMGTRYCYFERLPYNGEEYSWGAAWAEKTEDGYLVKAEIPFRELGIFDPANSKIFINISIEDDGQSGYMMLRGKFEGFINAPEWVPAEFSAK